MTEPYVPIEELAKHFTVSVSTIRGWVKRKQIPEHTYIRVGNTYRFSIEDVTSALSAARDSVVSEDVVRQTPDAEDAEDTKVEEEGLYSNDQWRLFYLRIKDWFYSIQELSDLNRYAVGSVPIYGLKGKISESEFLKWEEYNRQLLRSHDLNNAIHQISESFYGDLFDYDETGYSEDAGLMTDKKIQKMPDIDPLIDTQGCLVWNESLWTGETESGDID